VVVLGPAKILQTCENACLERMTTNVDKRIRSQDIHVKSSQTMIDDNNLYGRRFEKEKRPVRIAEAGHSTCERSVRGTSEEIRVTSSWTCKFGIALIALNTKVDKGLNNELLSNSLIVQLIYGRNGIWQYRCIQDARGEDCMFYIILDYRYASIGLSPSFSSQRIINFFNKLRFSTNGKSSTLRSRVIKHGHHTRNLMSNFQDSSSNHCYIFDQS
jgi:hypothetical protein